MQTMQVPADRIVARLNDRTTFHAGDLEKLAQHIAENGLISPPEMRRVENGLFEIVSGERRTRAMRDILGWTEIPAQIVELTDEQAITHMLAENRNRVNLNPMEEAAGYQVNMARFGWTVATCARKSGTTARVVSDRLALLALCPEAQELAASGQMSPGYALILALAAQNGLSRNMQNRSLDLLRSNPAPTVDWYRAIVSDLIKADSQQGFSWGEYSETKQAEIVARLPHPSTDNAPVVGDDTATILANTAAYWEQIAGQYEARDDKARARDCRTFARGFRQAASVAVAPSVLTVPLTGRCGRQVCACGQQATQEIARAVPRAGGTRIIIERVCSAHAA